MVIAAGQVGAEINLAVGHEPLVVEGKRIALGLDALQVADCCKLIAGLPRGN